MTQNMPIHPQTDSVTEEDLRGHGFTADEIAHLRSIREMYPYIEYVDSRYEWHRLKFVKWLYHKGEFTR
jgi:hypothetical protein